MPADYSSLDFLSVYGRCFAVYRVPGKSPVLYVQDEPWPDIVDQVTGLNGRSGFVVAPFHPDKSHPVVVIRPDHIVQGEANILKWAARLSAAGQTEWPEARLALAESELDEDSAADMEGKGRSRHDFDRYKAAFELFQKALHAGSCDKIVLSRTHYIPLRENHSMGRLFQSACEAYPDAFVHWCSTPVTGTWMGISPEVLLSGNKDLWQTVALAGTRRSNGKQGDWDAKNIREQQIVSSYLDKQLRISNLSGTMSEPYTVRAGQVMHLRTDFRFEMKAKDRIGDLLECLHPTPAVSGYPKMEACRLILAHEGYDRSYYSGFVGPLNRDGKTDLYVNLRCARLAGQGLLLYAGGGLMPDSDLMSEWDETEVKLQTLSSLIPD